MRYRLRTLLILMAIGPPILAGASIAIGRVVAELNQPLTRPNTIIGPPPLWAFVTPQIPGDEDDKLGIELEDDDM